MTTAWFASISSLVGVLIGAWTTYLIQKQNWVRETRRQVYASFIGECRIWLESINRVRYAIQHRQARESHWDRANAGRTRLFGLRAQIELLGTRPTQEAALVLERSINDINEKIYNYGHDQEHPPNSVAYREEFDHSLNGFRRAASDELHLSRLGPKERWRAPRLRARRS